MLLVRVSAHAHVSTHVLCLNKERVGKSNYGNYGVLCGLAARKDYRV